jgi:predicted  nucleic acid-binding Zn-ribbon protein
MSNERKSPDPHKRLDDLKDRIAETKAEMAQSGDIARHHRARIDEIYGRARKMRQKLLASDESIWDAMKDELVSEWQALKSGFEDWVNHVDEDYKHPGSR